MSRSIPDHNARAWDRAASAGGEWSRPVGPDVIERARRGDWSIILTPDKTVPRHWFPPSLAGVRVLALAGSGGQQVPVLAAAGADVTAFDISENQLGLDRLVARREGLFIRTERGDMADLSRFADASFDLVVNPCSVCFVPEVNRVWREVARVLKPGGRLMTGFLNPAFYLFDHDGEDDAARRTAVFALPYRDDADDKRRAAIEAKGETLQFSHTLSDLVGGQLRAGLRLVDLYEDHWPGSGIAIDAYMACYLATLAERPETA